MKILLVLAVLAAAAPARAESRAGTVALGLTGGAGLPLGTRMVRDNSRVGPDYGVTVRYGLEDSLDAAFSYDSVQMFRNRHTRLEPYLASLIRSFDLGGRWSPALRLGAGPVIVHGARSGNLPPYTSFAVRAGTGVEFSLAPNLALGCWADPLPASLPRVDARILEPRALQRAHPEPGSPGRSSPGRVPGRRKSRPRRSAGSREPREPRQRQEPGRSPPGWERADR